MEPEIKPATEAYVLEVESWLKAEEETFQIAEKAWFRGFGDYKPISGFYCNWDSVVRDWRAGHSLHILIVEGQVIGFLAGKDILEIRPDRRGAGYGRLMAEFMIEAAHDDGLSVLEIEIAPSTAEPFWKSMGFNVIAGRRGPGCGTYAYKVLHRRHSLGDGEAVPYTIEYFTEYGFYRPEPRAFASFEGVGERLCDGNIQIEKRAYCFEEIPINEACFIRIEIDGKAVYFDKIKYSDSRAFGVEFDFGGIYYVDRVILGLNS